MSPKKMIRLSFAAPAAKLYEVFDKLFAALRMRRVSRFAARRPLDKMRQRA